MPLIPSDRPSRVDLALWSDLEKADRVHGARLLAGSKVGDALAALREFLSAGPAYVSVSWGKDSVVVAHLCREACPTAPLVHLRPTNHNPDCDAVRDHYLRHFPGQQYAEQPVDYGNLHAQGLPRGDLDRLTDSRWYAAIAKAQARYGGWHVSGVRAEESFGRRARCRRWGVSSPNSCAPLAWWTVADVFGYLAAHDLPVHPAYACLGGGRWEREQLRVAEIGDTRGTGLGRAEWEWEYYGDVLRRLGR